MFLRECHRSEDGKDHRNWALVESVRTASGPAVKRKASVIASLPLGWGRVGVRVKAKLTLPFIPSHQGRGNVVKT